MCRQLLKEAAKASKYLSTAVMVNEVRANVVLASALLKRLPLHVAAMLDTTEGMSRELSAERDLILQRLLLHHPLLLVITLLLLLRLLLLRLGVKAGTRSCRRGSTDICCHLCQRQQQCVDW